MTKKAAIAAPQPEPPRTREEMEELVRSICILELEADGLYINMESDLQAVRARYQDRITWAREEVKEKLELAEAWALANPTEFAGKKSVIMVHGTVGYRTGMPKLKTLRGWTWDRVLNVLKVAFPEYVRTKEEPAKDMILDRRDEIGKDKLKSIGLEVVQEESFYVEPHADKEIA